MHTNNPTKQLYDALLTAYTHFNDTLFNGELPTPLIVLQRQAKTMGYVSHDRWQSSTGGKTDELAVNPEYFWGYPLLEVLQTLVHEQCHIKQFHFGTPGRRKYHNRQWANMMLSVGLVPSDTSQPGGKQTGEKIGDYAIINGAFYRAATSLLKTGFVLPWLDRAPKLDSRYSHAVYNEDGGRVDFRNRKDEIMLVVPLGYNPQSNPSMESTPAGSTAELQLHMDETLGEAFSSILDTFENSFVDTSNAPPLNLDIQPISHVKKPTRAKYRCSCKNNVWGKSGLSIFCGDCDEEYQEDPRPGFVCKRT